MYILIAGVIAIVDQFTKWLVTTNIGYNHEIQIIESFFYITYVKNKGAAWGILQNQRLLFVGITILVIIGVLYLIAKEKKNYNKLVLSFILGGALGNFIDRIFRGYVIDYINITEVMDFPVFNLADSFIVIGVIILIIFYLRGEYIERSKSRGK